MKLKYINKIQANLTIYSSIRTSNLLEGNYKSVYRGKSMNFENLREYVLNDDIKDIDWKASSRSGTLLVKQFIAEKKHNIMLVMDTGIKMDGQTNSNYSKKEIALYTAGTIGYLAIKNGNYIGMTFNNQDKITQKPFKYDLYSLEQYLTEYNKNATIENTLGLEKTLEYLYKNVKKKMIIFIITDLSGLDKMNTSLLKKLRTIHDILLININDTYLNENNLFDLEEKKYLPNIILNDPKLITLEREIRKSLLRKCEQKFKRMQINLVTIDNKMDINMKTIELLERHKYANKY